MDISAPLEFLISENGEKLAYKVNKGAGPTFIWCGGLKSDMEGGKAQHCLLYTSPSPRD